MPVSFLSRWVALGAAALALVAHAEPAAAAPPPVSQTWRCEVVYAPARTVWPRTVRLAYDDRRLLEVAIDGVPVYRFAVYEALVLTSLDNERVRLDAAAMTWSSDFRGVASGEGRCERLP